MKHKTYILLLLLCFCSYGKAQQPNIVWIVSEDNSKHYLKLFNKHGVTTPNIEKLAKKGITFTNAFSNAAVCSAARSSIITGVYGPKLASHYHRSEKKIVLPNTVKMFPVYLQNAGYYTANNAKEDYNIVKNKDVWDDSSRKASWKNRANNQPFFYVHNLGTTHEGSLHFSEEEMNSHKTKTNVQSVFVQPNHPNTKLFKFTNAFYRDKIVAMDKEVGAVINALEKDKLLSNTIIFYYGDHGGVLPNSKGYLKETGLQVPLVVYIPEKYKKMSPFTIGTSTNTFVSFIDFSATVLNLAGVTIPKSIDGSAFLGESVKQKTINNNSTFGYADRFDEKYDMVRSIRENNLKYIRNFQPFNIDALMNNYRYKQLAYKQWSTLNLQNKLNPIQSSFFKPKMVEELYDVKKDPYETNNLAKNAAYKHKIIAFRQKMNTWQKAMPDLSFYPEHILVEQAFKNPLAYGKKHQKKINKYIKIANLQLIPFKDAKTKLKKHLLSKDKTARYWALITSTSFGSKATSLSDLIKNIMLTDADIVNKMRAAEFLAIAEKKDPSKNLIQLLYQSKKPKEALLILNSIVLQKDFYQKYTFTINQSKLHTTVKNNMLIQERLKYLQNQI